MEGGGFAAARPSIVRKEIGGALNWNRGHLPFNHKQLTDTQFLQSPWRTQLKTEIWYVTSVWVKLGSRWVWEQDHRQTTITVPRVCMYGKTKEKLSIRYSQQCSYVNKVHRASGSVAPGLDCRIEGAGLVDGGPDNKASKKGVIRAFYGIF